MTETLPTETTRISVRISNDLLKRYESEAEDKHVTVEELLAQRLLEFVACTSGKGIYITDGQRRELEKIVTRNVSTAEDLIASIKRSLSVRIGMTSITLAPSLITRLKSRCFGKSFEEFLSIKVKEGLEQFVGLR